MVIINQRRSASNPTVSRACEGLAYGNEGEPTPVDLELRWCADDPAAVTAAVRTPEDGDAALWTFARRLLPDSLENPGHAAGNGDVRVTTGGFSVYLQLRTGEGSLVVEVPIFRVQAFVRSVGRLHPAALEEEYLAGAVDRAVDLLLTH